MYKPKKIYSTILYQQDQRLMFDVNLLHLEKLPFEIVLSRSLTETSEKLLTISIDLLIMNVDPERVELALWLKNHRTLEKTTNRPPVPIIIISTNDVSKQECITKGCTEYLVVPVSKKDINKCIEQFL